MSRAAKKTGSRTISKKEFCDRFFVSPKTVDRLCAKGMDHERKARGHLEIPMPKAWTWYRDYLVQQAKNAAAPTSYNDAKTRKMAAEAELAEHELAKARDELMTVTDFDRVVSDALMRADARLLALDAKLPAVVIGVTTYEEAKARISPLIEEAREELRRGDDVPLDEDVADDEPTETDDA